MVNTDIRFEQACVLYNIAALYTQAAYDSYSVYFISVSPESRFRNSTCHPVYHSDTWPGHHTSPHNIRQRTRTP